MSPLLIAVDRRWLVLQILLITLVLLGIVYLTRHM